MQCEIHIKTHIQIQIRSGGEGELGMGLREIFKVFVLLIIKTYCFYHLKKIIFIFKHFFLSLQEKESIELTIQR